MMNIVPTSIRHYPIPHGGEGTLHLYYGSVSNANQQIVLMCPGFPDDHRGFTSLADRLSKEDCFVGVMCLPGYEYGSDIKANREGAPDGYTFGDWVATIRESIKLLLKEAAAATSSPNSQKRRLTGIFHDWGVLGGLVYANQVLEENAKDILLDQIVILDVLPMLHPSSQISTIAPQERQSASSSRWIDQLCIQIYQFALALNFWLHQNLPNFMVFFFMYITEKTLSATKCFPISDADYAYLKEIDILPVQLSTSNRFSYMCYPYRNIRCLGKTIFDFTTLPPSEFNTPILFLYGGAKWVPLHDPSSLEWFHQQQQTGKRQRSRAVEIEGAGHWLHQSHEDECFEKIRNFIVEEDS